MGDDFHEFQLQIGIDRSVPEQERRKQSYRCRAYQAAIEKAGGPMLADDTLTTAFERCHLSVYEAAQRKIAASDGRVEEPVPIFAEAKKACSWFVGRRINDVSRRSMPKRSRLQGGTTIPI